MAILQREVGDVEKERLLKEHEENISKFQNKMKEEQDRTKEMLRKKLEERRNKKMNVVKEEKEFQGEAEKPGALQKQSANMLISAVPSLTTRPLALEGIFFTFKQFKQMFYINCSSKKQRFLF